MPSKVLDSWALIAFFEDEPAADAVEELIHRAAQQKHRLYLSVINWAEVYYTMERAGGRVVAEQTAAQIATLPIEIVGVADDLKIARQAAIYKASHKMSLADAFAAALAKEKKAELVTGDPEFKAQAKEIKIQWIGQNL